MGDVYAICEQIDPDNGEDYIFCHNCISEMLGYSNIENPQTYLTNTNYPQELTTQIEYLYKNWSNQEKVNYFVMNLQTFDGLRPSQLNAPTNSNNLYKLGERILDNYFNTIYNGEKPSLKTRKNQPLLQILYNFAINYQTLGIFSLYLKDTLCKGITSDDILSNINYKNWCGCYLQEYKNTVDAIDNQRLQEIKDADLDPSTSDKWRFGNECMPYCSTPESIKIYYSDNSGSTLFKKFSDPENDLMFEPVPCVATVCIINDFSSKITGPDGVNVNINQLCKCSLLSNCICIIDKNIKESSLGKINPGLDNHVILKQTCGKGALCAVFDESGNIISLNLCPTDSDGNPDPTLPEYLKPENGKFNPRKLSSIKNVNVYNLFFINLVLFLCITLLYFLSAKRIKNIYTSSKPKPRSV